MSHVRSRRRIPAAPALFLALWAFLLCSAPAVAADQTNPAGTTITANPGMAATANGDRLTNNGNIAITATGADNALGMGGPNPVNPLDGLALTNNGAITASQTGTAYAYGMSGGANSSLDNSGTITASATGDNAYAYGMSGNTYSTLINSGSISAIATGDDGMAWGMLGDDNSTLFNSGAISASATGNNGQAFGMYGFANSTVINSGTITASATGSSFAFGIFGDDNSTLANSGTVTVTATGKEAHGMYGGVNSTLTNSGAISASGITGQTQGMWGDANSTLTNSGTIAASASGSDGDAYGMYAEGANSTVINSGTIAASASGSNGRAWGMYAEGANSTMSNSGTITASATGRDGKAYGMYVDSKNSSLINSGTITAGTTGTTGSDGRAWGMYVSGDHSSLINSGSITASATGSDGRAWGIYVNGDHSSLINSGTITASATGSDGRAYGMAVKGDNNTLANTGSITAVAGNRRGFVYGMYVDGKNSSLDNSGTITAATAGSDSSAFGMFAEGSYSTLTNSESITVTATGANSSAYGMDGARYSNQTNTGAVVATATAADGGAYGMSLDGGTIANTGLVRAVAPNPANTWEVYNWHSTDTVRITEWATDLRDFTAHTFYGTDGGNLDFDGSRLTLRPGTAERGFAWGREYAVADMAGGFGQGAVASVRAEVPWARAQLTGTDWTDQKLSLHPNFTRKTNPGQGVTSQGIALVLNQMRGMDGALGLFRNTGTVPVAVADSGPAAFPTASGPDSGWSGFLTPYYSYVDNSDLDYDAKIAGFMAGATRRFNDAFAAGVHLGFSHADVSADLADQKGDTLTGLFGLHGIYNLTPEWYLRGQLTGFISRASNDWQSGLPAYTLYSNADVDSRGLYASLATGYDWRINANNTITPEIGLSWLWSHQDSYSLNWEDRFGNSLSGYDLDYKAQDYNALYGTAMVRWRGDFALAGGSFQPALGVGVRQTLTDGDVKSRLTTAGSSFSTKATEDETTALAEAGFVWQRGITSVGLTYTGGYGDDQVVHTGWLTLKVEF